MESGRLCAEPNGLGTHRNGDIALHRRTVRRIGPRNMRKDQTLTAPTVLVLLAVLALLAAGLPAYPADNATGQKTTSYTR